MATRKRLLTVHEVAELMRVNPETVRVLARRGELRASKVGTGRTSAYRFTYEAVADYLQIPVDELPDVA